MGKYYVVLGGQKQDGHRFRTGETCILMSKNSVDAGLKSVEREHYWYVSHKNYMIVNKKISKISVKITNIFGGKYDWYSGG